MVGIHIAARHYESVAASASQFRREKRRLREFFAREDIYRSQWADDYATYCNALSLGTCACIARYSNILIIVSVRRGSGVTLEQAPELFALVDAHVHQTLSATQ